MKIDSVVRSYSDTRRALAGSHGQGLRQARQSHDGRAGWWSAPDAVTTADLAGSGPPGHGSSAGRCAGCASGRPTAGGLAGAAAMAAPRSTTSGTAKPGGRTGSSFATASATYDRAGG
jgi:hypothetical protein